MPVAENALPLWAAHYRKPVSVTVAVACFFLVLFTSHSWEQTSAVEIFMEWTGFILITLCVLGRMWSAFYICGYKDDQIITQGPYAMVRNPLYLFSFIGALGIGLASENLVVLIILVCAFVLYYPLVVYSEEKELLTKFGQVYTDYAQKVTRFVPRTLSGLDPESYPAKPRQFKRALLDSMWFFWFFMILQIIEWMHLTGFLPVWLRIP